MGLEHGVQVKPGGKLEPDHGHLKYFPKEFGLSSGNNELFDMGSDWHTMTDT